MLTFLPVDINYVSVLESYYKKCTYRSCEYSVGTKLFWRNSYPYTFCEYAGCLIVKYEDDSGRTVFDFPVSGDCQDINQALEEIEHFCAETEISLIFSDVPKEMLPILVERYPHIEINSGRNCQEYLYNLKDLRDFEGKHYSGQRNHIHQFTKQYPDYKFRELTGNENFDSFFEEFRKEYGQFDESAQEELGVTLDMQKNFRKSDSLFGGYLEVNGSIIAFSIAEITGDTMIIHIEKGLYQYKGVYPTLVSEFLKHFANDSVKYVNREEDAGEKGLRTSKSQYCPFKMVEKSVVTVHSELYYIKKIPTIKSQRLVLSKIQAKDSNTYAKLCMDKERNKYWGDDWKKYLKEPISESWNPSKWFFEGIKEDFKNKTSMSLGIYLKGKFIGEVVVYNPDFRGSLEIGCRIDSAYSGNGYGTEAFNAITDWTLYKADCRKIVAKCFKENKASEKMLSSCMKKTEEDETFLYFEKFI